MQPDDNDTNWIKNDAQSALTDDLLLCGECSLPYEPGPRLEKTGEETYEDARVEDFECLDCGATGSVQQSRDTGPVTRYGCVTTPRLLDLKREAAWARTNGGRY